MGCRCQQLKRLEKKFGSSRTVPIKQVYLDHAATTPVDLRTLAVFEKTCRTAFANPASFHQAGLTAATAVEEAREIISHYLAVTPQELFFSGGGTEALHCAIAGLRKKESSYITTAGEHAAIRNALSFMRKRGVSVTTLPIDAQGRISLIELENILQQHRDAIMVYSPVNHETGALQQIREIYTLVHKYNGVVIMDAIQTISRLLPAEWAPFADLIAISSHKIYAPKGTGILCVKQGITLKPFRFGGRQEAGLFPGTPNVPGIAATAQAVDILQNNLSEELRLLQTLTAESKTMLTQRIDQLVINTPHCAAPGIINISIPTVSDIEDCLIYLSSLDTYVGRMSACTSSIKAPSSILTGMGFDRRRAATSLRLSFGRTSTREDIFTFIKHMESYKNVSKK